jgi:hypothetical protein
MSFETDDQIIARKAREKELKKAWRAFSGSADRKTRRALSRLPAANPQPKAIIVTHNHRVDTSPEGKTCWKSWRGTGQ